MNDITVHILLEFLYNDFAVTFVFCLIGSWIRETLKTTKKDNKSKIDIKKIVISTVFSTFLMCACAEYIDLPFSVYAVASIFCGMWGLIFANIVMSGNFITKFLQKFAKKVANPILDSAVESASEILEEESNNKNNDGQQ